MDSPGKGSAGWRSKKDSPASPGRESADSEDEVILEKPAESPGREEKKHTQHHHRVKGESAYSEEAKDHAHHHQAKGESEGRKEEKKHTHHHQAKEKETDSKQGKGSKVEAGNDPLKKKHKKVQKKGEEKSNTTPSAQRKEKEEKVREAELLAFEKGLHAMVMRANDWKYEIKKQELKCNFNRVVQLSQTYNLGPEWVKEKQKHLLRIHAKMKDHQAHDDMWKDGQLFAALGILIFGSNDEADIRKLEGSTLHRAVKRACYDQGCIYMFCILGEEIREELPHGEEEASLQAIFKASIATVLDRDPDLISVYVALGKEAKTMLQDRANVHEEEKKAELESFLLPSAEDAEEVMLFVVCTMYISNRFPYYRVGGGRCSTQTRT